jgi:hypothetical protein
MRCRSHTNCGTRKDKREEAGVTCDLGSWARIDEGKEQSREKGLEGQ